MDETAPEEVLLDGNAEARASDFYMPSGIEVRGSAPETLGWHPAPFHIGPVFVLCWASQLFFWRVVSPPKCMQDQVSHIATYCICRALCTCLSQGADAARVNSAPKCAGHPLQAPWWPAQALHRQHGTLPAHAVQFGLAHN